MDKEMKEELEAQRPVNSSTCLCTLTSFRPHMQNATWEEFTSTAVKFRQTFQLSVIRGASLSVCVQARGTERSLFWIESGENTAKTAATCRNIETKNKFHHCFDPFHTRNTLELPLVFSGRGYNQLSFPSQMTEQLSQVVIGSSSNRQWHKHHTQDTQIWLMTLQRHWSVWMLAHENGL